MPLRSLGRSSWRAEPLQAVFATDESFGESEIRENVTAKLGKPPSVRRSCWAYPNPTRS